MTREDIFCFSIPTRVFSAGDDTPERDTAEWGASGGDTDGGDSAGFSLFNISSARYCPVAMANFCQTTKTTVKPPMRSVFEKPRRSPSVIGLERQKEARMM